MTDLKAAYQVGEESMDFTRAMVSRLDPAVKIAFDSPFGDAGNWRHSFQWDILWNTNSVGAEKVRIIYPDGRWGNFDYDEAGSTHMTFLASTHERVLKQGTNYFLIFLDGTRHHFTRDDRGDTPTYQMQATYDPYSNKTEYVYSSNLLSEVRGPNTNQYLRFNYETLPNSVPPGLIEFSFTDSAATNVMLRGSFNDWAGTPMTQSNGIWTATVNLTNGWHYYKFTAQYAGDTNVYWFNDPDNEMWTYPSSNSVAVVDPYRLLSSVESSDGRTVSYQYDWSRGMDQIHLMLTNVVYGTSGLNAEYTYYHASNDLWRTTLLHTADDPMYDGPARALEYIYQPNNVYSGRIYQERSLENGQLLSELSWSGSTNNPYLRSYTDAAGNTVSTIHAAESGNVAERTNAVGDVSSSEYFMDIGMLKKHTDAMGRTTEYGRTTNFGAVTTVTNSERGTRTTTYSDYDQPFYKTETIDEMGRTNRWERDSRHRVTKQTFPTGRFETFAYNEHGQVVSNSTFLTVSTPLTTTTTYDSKGRKISETDPSGATTIFGYDAYDRLSAETNALGYVTRYQYDWRGSVTNILHPDGTEEQFFFNRYGQVTQEVARSGAVTLRTYDDLGYPRSVTDALGNETITIYDGEGRLLSTEKPSGLIISNRYDAIGRKIRETFSSDDTFNERFYSPDGVVSNINRLGYCTKSTYDSRGYLHSTTDPEGNTTTYAHDILGSRITSITNALGETTRYSYDLEGRRRAMIDDVGILSSNVFDAAGRLINQHSPIGNQQFTLDPMGRIVAVYLNGFLTQSNRYNAVGQLVWSQNADGLAVSNTYDSAGRLLKTFMPDGTFSENVYSNTFLVEQKDRAGRSTRFQHDTIGRVTNVTDNAGNTTAYGYNCDCGEALTDLIDAAGNHTEWIYDSEGRMTYKVYPDNTQIAYFYNAARLLTNRANARNQVTLYEYDKNSKLTKIDYETDADIIAQYDPLGRITNVTDAVGQTTRTYSSGRGLLTQIDGPFANDTLVYSYDAANRTTNLTCNAYSVDYGYDSLGRLGTVGGSQGTSTYSYLGNGMLVSSLAHPNDLTRTLAFDELHRITHVLNQVSGEIISSFGYTLNDADQRTRIQRDSYYVDYTYDPIGQLKTAQAKYNDGTIRPGYSYSYNYDSTGNPLRQERNGFVVSNSFNNLNQNDGSTWRGALSVLGSVNTKECDITVNGMTATLHSDLSFVATNLAVAAGTNTYTAIITDPFGRAATNTAEVVVTDKTHTYDPDGNLLSDGKFTYTWNNENRLIEAQSTAGVSPATRITYAYDYTGRQIQKDTYRLVTNNWELITETKFLWDGFNIISEISFSATNNFVWGLDLSGMPQGAGGVGGLLSQTTINSTTSCCCFAAYDANGNVTDYVFTNGTIVAHREYTPFGKTLIITGSKANDFTHWWSTKPWEPATGLSEYEYRKYAPSLARWISRDPIGNSGGLNLYAFLVNHPISSVDYLGWDDFDVCSCYTLTLTEQFWSWGDFSWYSQPVDEDNSTFDEDHGLSYDLDKCGDDCRCDKVNDAEVNYQYTTRYRNVNDTDVYDWDEDPEPYFFPDRGAVANEKGNSDIMTGGSAIVGTDLKVTLKVGGKTCDIQEFTIGE